MTVAGSDPSGGAGLQADIKTMTLLGCYAQAVPTALTVQNSLGVKRSVAVDAQLVYEQMAACMDDLPPHAVKIGIVPNAAVAKAIAKALQEYKPAFVVLDPVLVSSSGLPLVDEEGIRVMLEELMPLASLVTPNLPEARFLTKCEDATPDELAKKMHEFLPCTILVKGGHRNGSPVDVLYDGKDLTSFSAPRIDTSNSHGTGCVLSSGIASLVAQGHNLKVSIGRAKAFLTSSLAEGKDYDAGHGKGAMFLIQPGIG